MIKFFADIKKYMRYILYSARAELKAEVANSYLNWIWWILEPLCFMAIYAVIFGYFFDATEKYFSVFTFLGITMWEFFNKMLKTSVKLVKSNKPIVSKVYVPKYVLVVEKMMVNIFKMAISLVLAAILMIINGVPASLHILWGIPVLLSLFLFTFGISTIVLHYGVYVEDLANVINIGLRMMFYLTGVFYSLTERAGIWGVYLNRYNPLALLITSMRDALLYNRTPDLLWLGIWTLAGAVLSVIGILLIQKNENSYVKVM